MTSSLENSRLDSVFGSSSPEEARKHAQTLRVARETGEPVPRVGGTMAMQLYTDTITNPYIGWDDEIGNGFLMIRLIQKGSCKDLKHQQRMSVIHLML